MRYIASDAIDAFEVRAVFCSMRRRLPFFPAQRLHYREYRQSVRWIERRERRWRRVLSSSSLDVRPSIPLQNMIR